jgi:uncharacterized protein YegP (UPF0339 family)
MTTKKQTRKAGIHLFETQLTERDKKRKLKSQFYWHLVASNGRIIARSSETYTRKRGAVSSIKVSAKIFWDNTNRYMFYDHSKPDSPLQSYL